MVRKFSLKLKPLGWCWNSYNCKYILSVQILLRLYITKKLHNSTLAISVSFKLHISVSFKLTPSHIVNYLYFPIIKINYKCQSVELIRKYTIQLIFFYCKQNYVKLKLAQFLNRFILSVWMWSMHLNRNHFFFVASRFDLAYIWPHSDVLCLSRTLSDERRHKIFFTIKF